MPFTFSHPAIVLPLTFLNKQWNSATGLIIGSMAPDFEYFIRMKVQSEYSHKVSGLLWFDLPLGLLLCFLYHNIVRNTLTDNMPDFFYKRLSVFKNFDWTSNFKQNWFIVVVSILIGALSHLLWDSFTHETSFFVERFSLLQSPVQLGNWTVPLYKVIQHLSSVIGGLFITSYVLSFKTTSKQLDNTTHKYWLLIVLITSTIVILRVAFGLNYHQYGNLIVTVIAGGLIALILTPLILKKA